MWGSSRWALSKCAVGPTAQLCSLVRGDRRRAPRSLGLGPFCASHRVRLANEGAQNRAIDRNTLHVQRVYAQKRMKMAGGEPQQCSRCWHDSAVCICPKETSEVAALFPHRIIIYMHVKEFGRGSNTSSLCQVAFPQASKVLVASVPEDEEELARELSAKPQQTFVLYPSADSITFSQFMAERHRVLDNVGKSAGLARAAAEPLTIVLIDGTWSQTRRLAKKMPTALTKIRLDIPDDDTFNKMYSSPLRSQPEPGRLCTLSALALLTREFSEDSRVEQYLLGLLHLKSEAFLARHRKEWKAPVQCHSRT